MTARTLDGEAAAAAIREQLATRIAALADKGVTPGLGTILVGEDGPSQRYIAMKHEDATALGLHTREMNLDAGATQQEVEVAIEVLNNDEDIHAFIVQYPFPAGLDYGDAVLRMDPAKDADGLHPVNLGLLVMGVDAPVACTPAGIIALLTHHGVEIAGQHVVIVGRGLTIGRPLANLLSLKRPDGNAAVTVVHTGVADLGRFTREGDIVVAAAGSPGLITADMIKPGAAVVAAGVSFEGRKVISDVDEGVAEVAGWLSPRMGGVGPMTRALLMSNAVGAAERTLG